MTQSTIPSEFSGFRKLASQIDQLLRACFHGPQLGEKTQLSTRSLIIAILALGAMYGLSMGFYAVSMSGVWGTAQLLMAVVKVPLLFLLTVVVTFPSLYVIAVVQRCPLTANDILRLQLTGIVLAVALLASFAPVTAFFTLSTDSYSFMILLNVLFFGICGLTCLRYVSQRLVQILSVPSGDEYGPRSVTRRLFFIWLALFSAIGGQMGWILRPFVGNPDEAFVFFRERDSNFFEAVLLTIGRLFLS